MGISAHKLSPALDRNLKFNASHRSLKPWALGLSDPALYDLLRCHNRHGMMSLTLQDLNHDWTLFLGSMKLQSLTLHI
jgi:hypothetical protein